MTGMAIGIGSVRARSTVMAAVGALAGLACCAQAGAANNMAVPARAPRRPMIGVMRLMA